MFVYMSLKEKKIAAAMGKQIDESSITSIVLENESFRISAETFRDILLRVKRKREIEESETSELIKCIITNAEDWKINEIMVVLKENLTNINWIKVFELFDDKKFTIDSLRSFNRILECWKCINGENTFPYRIFFKVWNNKETQEEFLNYFIESREENLRVYNNVFLTRIITPEDLKRDKVKDDINLESHFNCLEFFKILKDLNQKEMIKRICVISNDWVFLGLSSVFPFCSKVFDDLFIQFLKKERVLFLSVIFRNSPALLIRKLAEARDKGFSLNKLLDIILELKILPAILEIMNPSFFCYEILILSSRRDHLNLSIWITNAFKLKKDVFASSLIGYIIEKFTRAEQQLKNGIKLDEDATAEKTLYPLTFEIALNILQTLEMLSNSFNRDVLQSFNRLKMVLPLELKNITEKKLSLEQQSNDFITSVVSGTRTVDQATEIIQNLVNGNLNERELAMKIFSTMLDNYHNFHRISSSKTLAFLFGRLIEKRLFPKFYMQKALRIIANLLKNVSSKEFRFALHTLSMFCDGQRKGEFDAFFEEISKIDKVKEFLLERKKNYVLEDDAIDEIGYDNFMDLFFTPLNGDIIVKLYMELKEDQIENVFLKTLKYLMSDNILNERGIDLDEIIIKTWEVESGCIKNIDIMIENDIKNEEHITKRINFFDNNSSMCSMNDNPQRVNQVYQSYLEQVNFSMDNTNLQHFLRYFFEKKIFETNNHFLLLKYFDYFGEDFYHLFCGLVFEMFRYLNKYRIDNEMRFAKSLGQFFGKFTIGMNRLYALDVFNMKEYIIGCVERKRIFFCVIFMVYFIRQGKFGLVFKPRNPYIMNLIYLLNEICEYSKDQLKEEIESLFAELKLTHIKQTSMLVNHVSMDNTTVVFLDSYNLGHFDKVHSKVVSMGIDFSIREVTFPLMERIMNISLKTMNFLFRRRKDKKDEYVYEYKRNFMINLIGNLTVVCSLEPMCAAIIGNVPYFLKMAGLEVENERVHAVARNNIDKCNNIIRNAIVTKVLEDLERGSGTKTSHSDLHMLQIAPDVEPTHIEPIKQTEYQEVKEKLSNIQKKQPDKKLEHILGKWGVILRELEGYINLDGRSSENEDREIDEQKAPLALIEEIVLYIVNSTNPDMLAENMCQNIISFLLRTNDEVNMELMFYFLKRLFSFSFKCQCEVSSWLIYSNDDRKFNIKLYVGFIKHNLIRLQELDQYFSQKIRDDRYLNFIVALLNQLNMPYEFINTIEAISKLNEEKYESRIYNMLKEVSNITFYNHKELSGSNLFDEYVKIMKYSFSPEKYFGTFFNVLNEKVKEPRSFIVKCFIISWDHFVRFYKIPSGFKNLKINCLPMLLREYNPNLGMEVALELFFNSLDRKNFLFQKMFLQFLGTSGSITLEVLHLLVPRNAPHFCLNFIKLCKYFITDFVQMKREGSCFDGFKICKELLYPLKYYREECNLILSEIQDFFKHIEILTRENDVNETAGTKSAVSGGVTENAAQKKASARQTDVFIQRNINYSLFYDIGDFFNNRLRNNNFVMLKNLFNKRKRRIYSKSYDFSTIDNTYKSIINYSGDNLVNILLMNSVRKDVAITALVDNLSDENPQGYEENCRALLCLSENDEWSENLLGLIFYRVLGSNPPYLLAKVCKELMCKENAKIGSGVKERVSDVVKGVN